jgi:hypothetical protein
MREAEKALFWDRLEGLAGDVRMMGYRYAEEKPCPGCRRRGADGGAGEARQGDRPDFGAICSSNAGA